VRATRSPGCGPSPKELDGRIDGLEKPGSSPHRLRLAQQQQASGVDGEMKGSDQFGLLGRLEVDQDMLRQLIRSMRMKGGDR
jgi:hypothetical protein